MRISPTEYYENQELKEKMNQLARRLISGTDTNSILIFPYNIIKSIKSDGSVADFAMVIGSSKEVMPRIVLVTFILPEYLCFSGKEEEVYELSASGPGYSYQSYCRIDSSLIEVVYHHNGEFTQLFGRPGNIKEFNEKNLSNAYKYTSSLLKSVFTIAFSVPTVDDPVNNTALYRSILRLAVAGLNKYADCFRRYVGIAWASVPHYSFYSFPYGYIREFDLGGQLVSGEKYMMNPATGILPERPHCIDPQGTVLEFFKKSLMSPLADDVALNMLKKGEAYGGHGHDLIAIRLCVSAVESILRSWAKQTKVTFKNSTVDRARIKDLRGKFEEVVKRKKLVKNANEFMEQVREAVDLRHKIEHENLYHLDSTLVFPAIEVLKNFFLLIKAELDAEEVS